MILSKIIKIVATSCQILRLKCTKLYFGWGSTPDPLRELTALLQSPDLVAGLKGPTSKRKGVRENEGRGKGTGEEGERGLRRGGTGRGEERGRVGMRNGGERKERREEGEGRRVEGNREKGRRDGRGGKRRGKRAPERVNNLRKTTPVVGWLGSGMCNCVCSNFLGGARPTSGGL